MLPRVKPEGILFRNGRTIFGIMGPRHVRTAGGPAERLQQFTFTPRADIRADVRFPGWVQTCQSANGPIFGSEPSGGRKPYVLYGRPARPPDPPHTTLPVR